MERLELVPTRRHQSTPQSSTAGNAAPEGLKRALRPARSNVRDEGVVSLRHAGRRSAIRTQLVAIDLVEGIKVRALLYLFIQRH